MDVGLNSKARSINKLVELKRLLGNTSKSGLTPEVKHLIQDTVWKIEQLKKKLVHKCAKLSRSRSVGGGSRSRSASLTLTSGVCPKFRREGLSLLNNKLDKLLRTQSKSKSRSKSRVAKFKKPPTQKRRLSKDLLGSKKLTFNENVYLKPPQTKNPSNRMPLKNISNVSTKFSDDIVNTYKTGTYTSEHPYSQFKPALKSESQVGSTKMLPKPVSEHPLSRKSTMRAKSSRRIKASTRERAKGQLLREIQHIDQSIVRMEETISDQIRLIQDRLKAKMLKKQAQINTDLETM